MVQWENMRILDLLTVLLSNKILVAGGGDSVSAINNFGYTNAFTYLSSGGGATLEYLTTNKLPGLEGIDEDDEVEVLDM